MRIGWLYIAGRSPGRRPFGVLLHSAAESPAALGDAFHAVAPVPDGTGGLTVALRTRSEFPQASSAGFQPRLMLRALGGRFIGGESSMPNRVPSICESIES